MLLFLNQLPLSERAGIVKITSKLDISNDVGDLMPKLIEHFAYRRLFLDLLLTVE